MSTAADRRADLPTGVVSFLFSDVEGSTRLLQELGEEGYAPVLEEHARLIRAAIASGGGIEVGTEGDSFFAVFAVPAGAVSAAVAAQQALARAAWPGDVSVKVRIGIHTGEGRRGGDNYVGMDVHRAARIAAAAHGGQVLISDETRALVERTLPEDASLRDLGEHRLKDLDRAEHLFQVSIAGLREDFPRLRSLEAPGGNLPAPLTNFVGRERQLGDLEPLLRDHRLVTLTGPGGTGKTRLALAVAERVQPAFPGGAFFVGLDTVREGSLVASLIAQALGLAETRERSPMETLVQHLRDRGLLLVLDNVEQVVDATPVIEALLRAAPELRILATGRSPLHLYGEQLYPVPPLGLPDLAHLPPLAELRETEAVRLFVDRVRIGRPDFDATEENAPTIAAITARLDGLPLAIELAAARVKLLPPQALLRRLEHRLDLLASGFQELPARQRTLRGAIEWSHEMLAEPERVLLRRLSVFAGGCTVDAAGSVCNPDRRAGDDPFATLANLVDGSLLQQEEGRDGEPRFRLLETIREYAREQLVAAGEVEAFDRRLAEHEAELAEALEPNLLGREQLAALDTLTDEHDNLRAALRWASDGGDTRSGLRIAIAVWRFWQQRSHLREGRQWLDMLLVKPDAGDDPVILARAVTAAGSLAYWQGDLGAAGRHYERELEIGRQLGNPAMIGDGLRNLGFVAVATRDVPKAVELFGEAVEWLEKVDDRFPLAEARASYGMSKLTAGDPAAARGPIAAALEAMLELGVLPRAADASMALGVICRRLGDMAEGVRLTRQALELVMRIGDVTRMPIMLDATGALALERGKAREAVRLAGAASRLRTTIGGTLPTFIVNMDEVLATARLSLGDAAFEAAWAEGEALDADRATSYAFEVFDAPGS